MFISFLRYRSIVHPLTPLWNKRKFFIGIILVLFLSIVIGVFEIFEEFMIKNRGVANFAYALSFKLVEYIIPSTLIVAFYFKSRRALERQNKEVSSTSQQQIRRRNETALKTLKHLMVVYFLTVFITKLLEIFSIMAMTLFEDMIDPEKGMKLTMAFTILFHIFSIQNNILNVVVYAIVMKDFRQFLKKISLHCTICKYFHYRVKAGKYCIEKPRNS